MPPTKAAAATSNSTENAVGNAQHMTQAAQGGAGKSTKPPNKALAVQTGSVASAAAATRLGVVDTPPPRLTMDQQIAADIADAKAASAKRHQRYIQVKAASLGVTEDQAEKIAQAENANARALAQKNWADIHTRKSSTSPDIVWCGKDVGWVTRE